MFRAARHAAELAGSAATKRSRLPEDDQALREMEAERAGAARRASRSSGSASRATGSTYEGRTLYVDPYVSRVPLSSLLRRRPAVPDPRQIERYFPTGEDVVGVLVGHTHFDHAVDAPAIAGATAARPTGPRRSRR